VSETDPLADAGKEQGEIIARYLISRMQAGKITPTEAVDFVAAHIETQAEEMILAGSSQEEVLRWLGGLRETVAAHLSSFVGLRN
jgi:hypothetical protein